MKINCFAQLQLMLEDMGEMTFDQIHPKVDNSLGDRSQRSTEIEGRVTLNHLFLNFKWFFSLDLCYSSNEVSCYRMCCIIL